MTVTWTSVMIAKKDFFFYHFLRCKIFQVSMHLFRISNVLISMLSFLEQPTKTLTTYCGFHRYVYINIGNEKQVATIP